MTARKGPSESYAEREARMLGEYRLRVVADPKSHPDHVRDAQALLSLPTEREIGAYVDALSPDALRLLGDVLRGEARYEHVTHYTPPPGFPREDQAVSGTDSPNKQAKTGAIDDSDDDDEDDAELLRMQERHRRESLARLDAVSWGPEPEDREATRATAAMFGLGSARRRY